MKFAFVPALQKGVRVMRVNEGEKVVTLTSADHDEGEEQKFRRRGRRDRRAKRIKWKQNLMRRKKRRTVDVGMAAIDCDFAAFA